MGSKLRISLLSVALTGCMNVYQERPLSEQLIPQVSYQLYLSRGSLEGGNFEQYKILPVGLFAECGALRRGRASGGQHNIVEVDPDKRRETQAAALTVYEHLTSGEPPSVDEPGTALSLADPGKFLLTVAVAGKSAQVNTSLDYVGRNKTIIAGQLQQLAQSIRGALPKAPCGMADFYGIASGR